MNHLDSLLRQIAKILNDQREVWALVGGLAVSVRTEPRFTRDLNLAVAVSNDREAESILHNLHSCIIPAVRRDCFGQHRRAGEGDNFQTGSPMASPSPVTR